MENKHTNYIDSRTEKEREEDSKIKVETTTATAVSENKNTWEERFDEGFGKTFESILIATSEQRFDMCEKALPLFKSFIRQEIDLEVKRREGELRKEIEGMSFVDSRQAGQFAMHADGYNQAIEEVLDLLTPKGRD